MSFPGGTSLWPLCDAMVDRFVLLQNDREPPDEMLVRLPARLAGGSSMWRGDQHAEQRFVLAQNAMPGELLFATSAAGQAHGVQERIVGKQLVERAVATVDIVEVERLGTGDPAIEDIVASQHRAPSAQGFDQGGVGSAHGMAVDIETAVEA